jgi:hypothetical protein
VHNVRVIEVLATQATKIRLTMEVADSGVNTTTHICIKGVLTDTDAMPSASIIETLFYRDATEKAIGWQFA